MTLAGRDPTVLVKVFPLGRTPTLEKLARKYELEEPGWVLVRAQARKRRFELVYEREGA